MKTFKNTCPRDCYDTCSLITLVEGNKVVSIKGNPDHPVTKGFLCAKGSKLREYVYSKNRVLYPMGRTGRKGEGKFKRIRWSEALRMIAEKIRYIRDKYGSEAILHFEYQGNTGLLSFYFPQRLFNAIGASGINYTICDLAGEIAVSLHYGLRYGSFPSDLEKAKLIVFWGFNPASSSFHKYVAAVLKVREHDEIIYVIDPIKTKTAKLGRHLRIRPGTDAALAFGVANYLIENNLVDLEFIEKYTYGFKEFREQVSRFNLSYVSDETGIPREDIVEFAEKYGRIKPSVIEIGYGLQKQLNGGEIVRAICLLPALVGLHRGFYYCNSVRDFDLNYLSGANLAGKPIKKYNMVKLGELLLKDKIKMIYIYNSNPLETLPNQRLLRKAFERKDLFVVVHDVYFTETAKYADIILPATTFLEHFDVNVSYWHEYISVNEKVIKPLGEAKSNVETTKMIAKALNLEIEALYEDEQQVVEELLKRSKMADFGLKELIEKGFMKLRTLPKNVYQTPTGRIEFYSTRAREMGFNPLPRYFNPGKKNMLRLITSSHPNLIHTQYRDLFQVKSIVYVNPVDAIKRGIKDGDRVYLKNNRGSISMEAKLSEDIPPGVVWTVKSTTTLEGGNINFLTTDDIQEYGGGSSFNSTFIELCR